MRALDSLCKESCVLRESDNLAIDNLHLENACEYWVPDETAQWAVRHFEPKLMASSSHVANGNLSLRVATDQYSALYTVLEAYLLTVFL